MDTSWVEHEFAAVTLRDQRQRPSLLAIVERLSHHPEWSFSANCGPALRKAGWRLFSQPDVELQTAHRQASLERAGACPRVLVVQDTTDLNYHTHGKTQGLGVLGGPNIAGLSLHSALLLDAQGVPLGLLGQRIWAPSAQGRPLPNYRYPLAEKESHRWVEALTWVNQHLAQHPDVTVVADREADFYAYLAWPRPANTSLLVRVQHLHRGVDWHGHRLPLSQVPFFVRGQRRVEVARQSGQAAQSVDLSVDVQPLRCPPAERRTGASVAVWVVRAWEVAPASKGEAIDWYLLSTKPIHTLEEAYAQLDTYCLRWRIERFHYVLKQGLRVERLQFDQVARLSKALQVYSVIAWHLLYLTHQVRHTPQEPAQLHLSEPQVAMLEALTGRQMLTLQQVVLSIAGLAGFQATKKQPLPGEKLLWRGLDTFYQLCQGWDLARVQIYGTG